MNIIDIMLDLETLGLGDNVVITQIAAVPFSLSETKIGSRAELEPVFNEFISVRSSVNKGFKIDGSTVEWWCKQPSQVYNDVFTKALCIDSEENDIETVLNKFNAWLGDIKEKYGNKTTKIFLWGNGALADNKWLRQAYALCKITPCWHFTEDRDVRTLVDLGKRSGYDYKTVVFEGTAHNALDDCNHQIKYCCEIYKLFKP